MGQVFISYSHDNADHQKRVLALAERLRADHIQVVIDRDKLPGGPAEGWPAWSEAQVRTADRVLVVASAAYRRRYEQEELPGTGLGSVCEANAIRQALYDTGGINERFRVVLLGQESEQEVPQQLAAYHRFSIFQETGYAELCAWLQGRRPAFSTNVAETTGIVWPEPRPDHDWLLADRKEICASFQAMVTGKSAKRILLLEGPTNTGKTVLFARLTAYAGSLGMKTAALDFKGCPGLDELFNALYLDLGPDVLADSRKAQGSGRFFSSPICSASMRPCCCSSTPTNRPRRRQHDGWKTNSCHDSTKRRPCLSRSVDNRSLITPGTPGDRRPHVTASTPLPKWMTGSISAAANGHANM